MINSRLLNAIIGEIVGTKVEAISISSHGHGHATFGSRWYDSGDMMSISNRERWDGKGEGCAERWLFQGSAPE